MISKFKMMKTSFKYPIQTLSVIIAILLIIQLMFPNGIDDYFNRLSLDYRDRHTFFCIEFKEPRFKRVRRKAIGPIHVSETGSVITYVDARTSSLYSLVNVSCGFDTPENYLIIGGGFPNWPT